MARHVGIALPCQDQVDTWFMHDFYRAGVHHAFAFPDDDQTVSIHQSAILVEGRNKLCRELLEVGANYIIFLDTDMRFPPSLYNDLMSHDLPVVAANCAKRRRPISMTARKENPDDPSKLDVVWADPEIREGIEQVHVVGAAVMCIKRDVFFEIEYPWFHTPFNPDEDRFVGEDVYFCAQLKAAGIGLYIDHATTWNVGHVGNYVFRPHDANAEKERARMGLWDHLKPQQENVNGREAIVLAK